MRSFVLLLLLAPAVAAADFAPAVVPGESRPTATRLQEARKELAAGKWSTGIALLGSIVESAGGDLVPSEGGRSIQARLLCQIEVAKLPAEGLAVYRKRADAAATRALAGALEGRDRAQLARIVDDSFCSRPALTALAALGDLAFERGAFAEAEGWWRLIAPLGGGARGELVYPDPPAAVAERGRAKQLLARLFSGRSGFDTDLAAFRKQHPTAAGQLAGRKGTYADILHAVARSHRTAQAG
jgi:hypothetical protein